MWPSGIIALRIRTARRKLAVALFAIAWGTLGITGFIYLLAEDEPVHRGMLAGSPLFWLLGAAYVFALCFGIGYTVDGIEDLRTLLDYQAWARYHEHLPPDNSLTVAWIGVFGGLIAALVPVLAMR